MREPMDFGDGLDDAQRDPDVPYRSGWCEYRYSLPHEPCALKWCECSCHGSAPHPLPEHSKPDAV